MSIRELKWQIKLVVLEAQSFTSILPSLRIFRLKTYEISDLGQLRTRLGTSTLIFITYQQLHASWSQDILLSAAVRLIWNCHSHIPHFNQWSYH